ncbi:amidohydrolase family protein [Microbacterium awajiense]|uniref:Amidohydrolase family protein n=1 Tax=Microbacterium awajiense TaxID=415214 RepID=A0ABP7AL53_9MICO
MLIDAHAHVWDTAVLDYPWIGPEVPVPPVFLPAQLREGDREPTGFVFVQADCVPEQGLAEARWVAGLDAPDLVGIVAFAPLERADAAAALAELSSLDSVIGVRRLLQDEEDAFVRGPALDAGLAALARHGWSFDACVRWTQLDAVAELSERHDEVPIVLDHLGKPPLDDPDTDAFAHWRAGLARLAALPHVAVKLSGLPAETTREPEADLVGPWLRAAVDLFGPTRCLIGSDYPVSARGSAGRVVWFDTVRAALAPSDAEWAHISSLSARRIYRLR